MSNVKAPGAPAPGTFLFTSESVNEGHPDKICDQVSDAVLDACLKDDEHSRVACETCTKTGMVMIFGEITTNSNVNYEQVIRDALKDIGYDDTAKGLDYKTCNVVVAVEEQSPDIAQSVDATRIEDIGAGDQGIMFGYATDETESLMPLSHELATQIGARLTEVRKKGICEWARPDGKTQVRGDFYLLCDGIERMCLGACTLLLYSSRKKKAREKRKVQQSFGLGWPDALLFLSLCRTPHTHTTSITAAGAVLRCCVLLRASKPDWIVIEAILTGTRTAMSGVVCWLGRRWSHVRGHRFA